MDCFDPALKILTYFGFWKPTSWTKSHWELFYDSVRVFLVPLPYYLAFGQILRLILAATDLNEVTDTLFSMMSTINVCCKLTNIMWSKKEIIKLMDMLRVEWIRPMNKAEDAIYNRFNDVIRYVTLLGFVLVESTTILGVSIPIVWGKTYQSLPVEVWTPYNYSSSAGVYWFSYIINSMCAVSVGNLSIGTDVTVYGLMFASSYQLQLLTHRLLNFSKYSMNPEDNILFSESTRLRRENYLLSQNVRHHVFICKFVECIADTFTLTLFSQFIVSSLAISVSVYRLTNNDSASDPEFYMMLFYLSSVSVQLFLFCWFGNDLTIRSEELGSTILEADWTALSAQSIKGLLMISVRTSKPILISRGHFIIFSLDMFKRIVKLSYTAFSVLRDSSLKRG